MILLSWKTFATGNYSFLNSYFHPYYFDSFKTNLLVFLFSVCFLIRPLLTKFINRIKICGAVANLCCGFRCNGVNKGLLLVRTTLEMYLHVAVTHGSICSYLAVSLSLLSFLRQLRKNLNFYSIMETCMPLKSRGHAVFLPLTACHLPSLELELCQCLPDAHPYSWCARNDLK